MKKVLLLLLLSISLVVLASCQNNSNGNDIIPEDNASSGNNSSTSGDNSNNNSTGSTDNSNNATIKPLEQAFVVDAIKKIPNIISVASATEYNDPNGQLNKQGGYIADIFFSVDVINQNSIAGITLVEKGTDAGGSIEIYNNVEDAKKRNEYLASFDGTILSSGSHKVIGTCVVRTSSKLTASLQNILSNNIEKALAGNAEDFVSMDTYLIEIAKQIAKEEKLSELGISAKLFELGYPLEKSKAIATTCGVNFDEIAKGLAEGYANYYATVYPKLIANLLSSQTFTEANIKYAIENANINWQAYAKIHAKDFVNITTIYYITPLDVVTYLNVEKGYSVKDSDYGTWNCEINWNEKALNYIEYVEIDGILGPKQDYITALTDVNFTQSQVTYALNNCNNDWNEHALLCLKHYVEDLSINTPTRADCLTKLKTWGFSDSESEYAIQAYELATSEIQITLDFNYKDSEKQVLFIKNNESFVFHDIPKRDGFIFRGWFTQPTCLNENLFYGNATENMTLYAGWIENIENTEIEINEQIDPTLYYDSKTAYNPKNTSRASNAEPSTHIYFTAMESGTHTVYIKFNSLTYTNGVYSFSSTEVWVNNLSTGKKLGSPTYRWTGSYWNTNSNFYNNMGNWYEKFYPVSFECNKGDIIYISIQSVKSNAISVYFDGFNPQTLAVSLSRHNEYASKTILEKAYCIPQNESSIYDRKSYYISKHNGSSL